jgi:hypothetical protein
MTTRKEGLTAPRASGYIVSEGGHFSDKIAERLHVSIQAGAHPLAVSRTVTGNNSALAYTLVYTAAAGQGIRVPMKVHHRVRGRVFTVALSWSSIDRVILSSVGLEAATAGDSNAIL